MFIIDVCQVNSLLPIIPVYSVVGMCHLKLESVLTIAENSWNLSMQSLWIYSAINPST